VVARNPLSKASGMMTRSRFEMTTRERDHFLAAHRFAHDGKGVLCDIAVVG
jgi:hypothetical protein